MKLEQEKSVNLDNEVSEACLTSINAIIRRCPREVSAFIPNLFRDAINLLEYDPNYTYNEDDEMQ